MNNLPEGMIPDKDNQVYFDTERCQFYMIRWIDWGNSDSPERIYIKEKIENKDKDFSNPELNIERP